MGPQGRQKISTVVLAGVRVSEKERTSVVRSYGGTIP